MSEYPQGIDRLMEFVFRDMPTEPVEPRVSDNELMAQILRELGKMNEQFLELVQTQASLLRRIEGTEERLRWVEICARQIAHRLKTGAISGQGG